MSKFMDVSLVELCSAACSVRSNDQGDGCIGSIEWVRMLRMMVVKLKVGFMDVPPCGGGVARVLHLPILSFIWGECVRVAVVVVGCVGVICL